MELSIKLSDAAASGLKQLSEKDLAFYYEDIQQYATHKAERLAAMTDTERREYEEIREAITESLDQIKRGECMTLAEAKARAYREMEDEVAHEKLLL